MLNFPKSSTLLILSSLFLLLLLVACGDETIPTVSRPAVIPTNTQAPTTAPTTTVAPIAPTTAASTTAAATTKAANGNLFATTNPTTQAPATVAVTTTTPSKELPKIKADGLVEVVVDAVFEESWSRTFASATNLKLISFASDETVEDFVDSIDSSLTGAGYKFNIPGKTGPIDSAGYIMAYYTKPGGVDVFVTVTDPDSAAIAFKNAGVRTNGLIALDRDLQGKSSIVWIITGEGVLASAGIK